MLVELVTDLAKTRYTQCNGTRLNVGSGVLILRFLVAISSVSIAYYIMLDGGVVEFNS